jgi:hypothetical protein
MALWEWRWDAEWWWDAIDPLREKHRMREKRRR